MGAGASDHATPCPPPHVARASIPMAPGMRLRCSPDDQLEPGHKVAGPAIVIEPHQTVVVEDGWQAELDA